MGTVFTVDVRDPGDWAPAIDEVVADLHHVDAVFSTYRADSDISRIGRGELTVHAADPLVAQVLDLCAAMRAETGGWFTAMPAGRLDPTGLVKGWAVERASATLRRHGSVNHAVNGGGDVQTAGEPEPGEPWRIGVSDPLDRTRVLAVVTGRDVAVATSGTAERGAHIVDPFTGRAATALAAVTVVGASLTRTDCFATAAFAMGEAAAAWLDALPEHRAVVVWPDGQVRLSNNPSTCTSLFDVSVLSTTEPERRENRDT
jgi:thiamine biosynthesis lipoprotein